MHNTIYKTLEHVMDFYHCGGGKGLRFGLENSNAAGRKTEFVNGEKVSRNCVFTVAGWPSHLYAIA